MGANGNDSLPGYVILGELGRGGMGAVYQGRDTDLGRDIAIKVLLGDHQGKAVLAQRFVEEAQIAGQLQHPGVTPVYELGRFPDERPYFTMKLVKGQTLADLLAARKAPAEDRPRFVGVFAQVCQTLAYAHARGVIHRDLKPSNIMVGAFGEVQVMDWGLAKVLAQRGAPGEDAAQTKQPASVIRTERSGDSDTPAGTGSKTRAGSVLGTPAYMAPEQARGDLDLVDARADVFGLGAILCEILTGKPPYTGRLPEILRKAETATLDDALARLDGSGADAELIGLARRCLAAEPWDRLQNAGEVTEAVTVYQESVAERLRQAELARAAEAARAEEAKATAAQERKAREAAQARTAAERRARRLTLGLAASVLLLVALGSVGGLWAQRQWAEREADRQRQTTEADRQRQGVEAALDKAKELRQQARWAEARAVLDQTHDRLGETGPEDLRQRLKQATADLALVDRLESIRLGSATWVEGKFDTRTAERDYAKEFREADLGEEGQPVEVVAARVRTSAVAEQLVAALDYWASVTQDLKRRAWLLGVARRADPDEWRDRFRDPKVWGDRAALERLAGELLRDEAKLATLKPPLLDALGNALYWAKADAVPLLAAAQAGHPDDFWLNFTLGMALRNVKKWDEAVGYYRGALAVRPKSVAAHNNLGNALRDKGQLDEAIGEFRAAIKLDPKDAKPHNGLGITLYYQGRLDEAIGEFRAAIKLDPKNAKPHNNLGSALRDKKQLDEAIGEFRAAIKLDPKFASPHVGLGNALKAKKEWDEAITEYRAAIKLDPTDALPHYNLGNALRDKGQLDEAITEYRAAIKTKPDFAEACCNLGHILGGKGQYVEALALLRRGHELGTKQPGWRYPSAGWVRQAERLVVREVKLPAFRNGKYQPQKNAERLDLVTACQAKELHLAAARLYADAFAADPRLADDLKAAHRYKAACCAVLAAAGEGDDAAKLDDKERSRWRKQALAWLRADLGSLAKRLDSGKADDRASVRKNLRNWQEDTDLAGIRDQDAVADLPATEREACQRLWADVEALLKKAEVPK